MGDVTWDILVCSIVHRTDMLALLLGDFERQLVPGVGVRVFRDNLETTVAEKRRRLVESSKADYVSFVDDDDKVHLQYIPRIYDALTRRPDVVGFKVYYTEDGQEKLPAYHSIVHGDWFATKEGLYRDISHLNPIRRDIALRGDWEPLPNGMGEDFGWAASLRKLGCVENEVWVDEPMYWYRHKQGDGFHVDRDPMVDPPAPPGHESVTWVS